MPAMLGLSLMYVPLGALLYGWIGRAGRRAEVPDYTCDQLGLLVGILEGLLWVLVDMKLILAEPHLRLHGFASELVIPAIAVRTSRSLAKSLGETIKAWRFSGAEVEVPDTA
jgi:hypothetical protein